MCSAAPNPWSAQKNGHTYKYYVTTFGKEVVATALKLRELVIIPQLAVAFAH
jgi:hypothetical protein